MKTPEFDQAEVNRDFTFCCAPLRPAIELCSHTPFGLFGPLRRLSVSGKAQRIEVTGLRVSHRPSLRPGNSHKLWRSGVIPLTNREAWNIGQYVFTLVTVSDFK